MKKQQVLKYRTGQEIPKGAIYLTTMVEDKKFPGRDIVTKFIWHYFLVEVEGK